MKCVMKLAVIVIQAHDLGVDRVQRRLSRFVRESRSPSTPRKTFRRTGAVAIPCVTLRD